MTLGQKIKSARMEAGLTQAQLADRLFVSRQAVTKWEADKGVPDIDNLKLIARFLGVSLDELLTKSPSEAGKTAASEAEEASIGVRGMVGKVILCTFLIDAAAWFLSCLFLGGDTAVVLLSVLLPSIPLLLGRIWGMEISNTFVAIGVSVGVSAATLAVNVLVYTLYHRVAYGGEMLFLIAWEDLICLLCAVALLRLAVIVPVLRHTRYRTATVVCLDGLTSIVLMVLAWGMWAINDRLSVPVNRFLLISAAVWLASMVGMILGYERRKKQR